MTVLWRKHETRTFNWGAIYISDTHRLIDDDHDFHEGGPVWAAPDHVAIAAVHAGAVDPSEADVTLLIQVLDRPLPTAHHSTLINVPSGTLNIGDADASDDLPLRPGQWRLQINLDEPDWPAAIEIHLSPAPEEADQPPSMWRYSGSFAVSKNASASIMPSRSAGP